MPQVEKVKAKGATPYDRPTKKRTKKGSTKSRKAAPAARKMDEKEHKVTAAINNNIETLMAARVAQLGGAPLRVVKQPKPEQAVTAKGKVKAGKSMQATRLGPATSEVMAKATKPKRRSKKGRDGTAEALLMQLQGLGNNINVSGDN